jgi:hypothetical protein
MCGWLIGLLACSLRKDELKSFAMMGEFSSKIEY